jgi:hypothetical protein
LSHLVLEVDAAVANPGKPLHMAATLAPLLSWQLRQQALLHPAPFTYSLQLKLNCAWRPHSAAWQALGRLTQLNSLVIHTAGGGGSAAVVDLGDLTALTRLSCLQYLEFRIATIYEPLMPQDFGFLSSMTQLTGELKCGTRGKLTLSVIRCQLCLQKH